MDGKDGRIRYRPLISILMRPLKPVSSYRFVTFFENNRCCRLDIMNISKIYIKVLLGIFFILLNIVKVSEAKTYLPQTMDSILKEVEFSPTNFTHTSIYDDPHGFFILKHKLANQQLGKDLVIRFQTAHYAKIYLYSYKNHKWICVDSAGNAFKTKETILRRYPRLTINTQVPEIYFFIEGDYFRDLDIEIQEKSSFKANNEVGFLGLGLYYGLSIMCILMNLLFAISFKNAKFVLYSLAQLTIILIMLYEDGLFVFITKNTWILDNILTLIVPISTMATSVFKVNFIGLRRINPTLYLRILLINIFLFLIFASYLFTRINLIYHTAVLLSIAFEYYILYGIVLKYKQGKSIKVLVYTYTLLLGIALLFYLNKTNLVPFLDFVNITVFKTSSIIEVLIISFVILFNIKELERENEKYRLKLQEFIEKIRNTSVQSTDNSTTNGMISKKIYENLQLKYGLTSREIEVLERLSLGYSNSFIAEELFISISTVKYHISNLYLKIGSKSRSQAAKVLHDIQLKETMAKKYKDDLNSRKGS
ncbi:LuxR C-terminal-related transcriptional regulator [Sphingobacterium sp. Mn56C]|uniref:LuxR C-terminal-related transcriptional regulator n=1 Tax=Sphingobacterium sp. Mn56C TaxID=3395261 RepID=UPI003BE37B63